MRDIGTAGNEIPSSVADFWDEAYQTFDPTRTVTGDLELPAGEPPVSGKCMLIVACGTGEHVIRACREGAQVTALDISRQAVENARSMAEHNGLSAQYVVADAGASGLEANALDVIWGSAVLHHLDHAPAAKEFFRILKPGGKVYMISEPTFFNPLLKFAYETAFGKGRTGRRRKFLFLERRGDDFEKPIEETDLDIWRQFFDVKASARNFMFVEKLGHVMTSNPKMHQRMARIDAFIQRLFPITRKFSYDYDFVFTKPADSSAAACSPESYRD